MRTRKTHTTMMSVLQRALLLTMIVVTPQAQALLPDLSAEQQADYELVVTQLNDLNGTNTTSDAIFSETYWVDAENGVNDHDRTGQIDQPWQSITWAMNNIPFDKDTANVVVRAGTYSPSVLYIGEERGGHSEADSPFNIMAFPGEFVKLDGLNIGNNGALISIAEANHVSISGFDISNITGSGKSAIYVDGSDKIALTGNNIHHSQWTVDIEASASPSLSDRFNGIAVVGDSQDITISNNEIHNLTTGYGDPVLVLDPAVAVLSDNSMYDNDADVFENQQYYVSTEGDDDKGVGSLDKPWRSIHKALFSIPYAEDNATINIREGRYEIPSALYFETLRGGSEGKYFTVQAYEGEEVVIDGGQLDAPFSAMVSISSAAYVRIKGLTFANLKGPKSGFYVAGSSHHIELIGNKLHDMSWADEASEDEKAPKPSDNLNPIAVIGNDPVNPIHSIVISNNELYDIVPGYSEGIKIVGNVTNFLVEGNNIHDIANIGIVAAGNYAWVKDSSGVQIPDEVNHARDGTIRNNTVSYAVSPVANSAGIYLDGAHNVLVEGNTSHHNSVGFSVGCEQPGTTQDNVLRNNIAYDNTDAGLVVGTVHAEATVIDTVIEFNEFKQNYSKGGWGGEVTVQQADGLAIQNNIVVSRSDLKIVAAQPATGLSIDNNLYFGMSKKVDAAMFDWGGIDKVSYTGLSEFQDETCHDINSMYQDADTVDYFRYLADNASDMTDDDLKGHNYQSSRGKKGEHHSRNNKKHAHRKGGLEATVCESGAIPAGEATSSKGKKSKVKHTHIHSHQHKHFLKRRDRKENGGKRFLKHTHPHTHNHKHKSTH